MNENGNITYNLQDATKIMLRGKIILYMAILKDFKSVTLPSTLRNQNFNGKLNAKKEKGIK